MKISRAVVVIGAAVVLIGGGAFAVNAATSDPNTVSLCVNSQTTTVSAPRHGDCVSGDLVQLPSEAAVDLLKNRVGDLESDVSALQGQGSTITDLGNRLTAAEAKIDQLTSRLTELDPGEFTATGKWLVNNTWTATFNGQHLQPGADVVVSQGFGKGEVDGHVGANGELDNVKQTSFSLCAWLPYTFATTTAWGNPISATVSSVPGC